MPITNEQILERLATAEVRIRRGLRTMDVLSRLARSRSPVGRGEIVPPLADARAHLEAARDTLGRLLADFLDEADKEIPNGD